ncbi:hypothetical protein WJX74_004345 [Apatococcus lobatus]|uniref:Coiled-coil domain-containing protein 61 n=1 Tax=Apatococcus lobatus TaxID=904363 RepID=A0AAW1QW76_9CHLO
MQQSSANSPTKQDTAPSAELDVQALIKFHGTEFAIHLATVKGETLRVLVERQEDASRWHGEFSAKHIEDVTSKTGSFKKYGVFIRMLITAVQQTSDSVVVDLLTFADLEELKSRRAASSAAAAAQKPAGTQAQPAPSGLQPSNKRYLILTYAAEFDRVHYPLPLAYEERPDPERLKGLIRQLRLQLTEAGQKPLVRKGNDPWAEVHRLREENARLQRQAEQHGQESEEPSTSEELARLVEEVQESARELHLVQQERDLLQQRSESAEAEIEELQTLHRRELRHCTKATEQAQEVEGVAERELKDLRRTCRELEREIGLLQRSSTTRTIPSRLLPQAKGYGSSAGRHAWGGPSPYGRGLPSSGAGSRPTSRGTSPLPSRPASCGRTPPLSRSSSPAASLHAPPGRSRRPPHADSSRPRSAPTRHRFDPTQYVREQQERQRGRSPSPAASRLPSYPSSVGTSPARSRASSIGRSRREQGPGQPRPASRSPVPPRPMRPHTSVPQASREDLSARSPQARKSLQPSSARIDTHTSREGHPRHAAQQQWSHHHPPDDLHRIPAGLARATSPGRALTDVKARLAHYAQRQQPSAKSRPSSPLPQQRSSQTREGKRLMPQQHRRSPDSRLPVQGHRSPKHNSPPRQPDLVRIPAGSHGQPAAGLFRSIKAEVFDTSRTEMADIDSRLHALQNFLRAAKSGVAPPKHVHG